MAIKNNIKLFKLSLRIKHFLIHLKQVPTKYNDK